MEAENRQPQSLQLSQVVAKFGNIENFKDILEKKGFIVIKSEYITWYYVAQIMCGQKQLCKTNQLTDFTLPPRSVY